MRLAQGPVPLYHQLEQNLRDRIIAREFAPGDILPTEERIGKTYGVSRITVRRALDALIAQGLIVRKRGVGSFVAERMDGFRSIQLSGSLDEFLALAGTLDSRYLSLQACDPPAAVTAALGLGENERAYRLRLISLLNNEPVGYLEVFFPQFVGERLRLDDLPNGVPVIRVVERQLGVRVARAEQTIEADLAGEMAAAHLGLLPSDPVLHVTRVYYLASGRPVEVAVVRHHPQRYRYNIHFLTANGAPRPS